MEYHEMFLIFDAFFILIVVIITIVLAKRVKFTINKENDYYRNSAIFEEAYQLIINNSELVSLQKNLNKYKSLPSIFLRMFISLFFLFFLVQFSFSFFPLLFLFFVLFIPFILKAANYSKDYKKYKDYYKKAIITEILKKYYPEFVYNHLDGMEEEDYRYAKFEDYNSYASEDLISGSFGDISFILADVVTKRVTKDNNSDNYEDILFSGTVAKLRLSKSINSFVYILNNSLISYNSSSVSIDNEEFEKIFDVLSDNKILAMRLLTPDVTNAILDLEAKTNIHFELKLCDADLYFRFYTSDLFEPKMEIEASAISICKYLAILNGIKEIMNLILKTIEEVDL